MIRTVLLLAACTVAPCGAPGSVRPVGVAPPFAMPTSAKVTEASADGKGWTANVEMRVSLEQAKAQLAARAAASGWRHVHTISLGKDRTLEAWSRGGEELTLMAWRIAPGRSGFSYGVTAKSGVGAGLRTTAVARNGRQGGSGARRRR